MQQIFTDNVYTRSFLAFAGTCIIFFLVFSAFHNTKLIAEENGSKDEFVCDLPAHGNLTMLFAEYADDEDVYKEFLSNTPVNVHLVIFCVTEGNFWGCEAHKINIIRNYFHTDLSPPVILKG